MSASFKASMIFRDILKFLRFPISMHCLMIASRGNEDTTSAKETPVTTGEPAGSILRAGGWRKKIIKNKSAMAFISPFSSREGPYPRPGGSWMNIIHHRWAWSYSVDSPDQTSCLLTRRSLRLLEMNIFLIKRLKKRMMEMMTAMMLMTRMRKILKMILTWRPGRWDGWRPGVG